MNIPDLTLKLPVFDDRLFPPPVLSMDEYVEWVFECLKWNPMTDEERQRRIDEAVNVPFHLDRDEPAG